MDVYPIRMTAAHARKARKAGNGNLSEGTRMAIEKLEEPIENEEDKKKNGR